MRRRQHRASRSTREGGRLNILSVQSWVSYGHVGNASAMFPLQRLGAEVWAIHTVQFSNHTGYGAWTGEVFSGASVRMLVRGIADRGALPGIDAVLSGYLGDQETGRAILDAVRDVRQANPAALYCCDPVMGDVGPGLFVRPGIPELLAGESVPAADILTPNQFELEQLTGIACDGRAALLRAVRNLQSRMRAEGPRIVLVTSVRDAATPDDAVELLAASPREAFLLRTPALAFAPNGAGDLIAALFLFGMLGRCGLRASLERAGSATWGVLAHTLQAGSAELCLVAAQDELVAPTRRFDAEPIIMPAY
jgi:pyridoxine kinase